MDMVVGGSGRKKKGGSGKERGVFSEEGKYSGMVSGRLGVMEERSVWVLTVLEESNQFIHFRVCRGIESRLLNFVYVSPHSQHRIELWRNLLSIT